MAKAVTGPSALRISAARPGDASAIRALVRAVYGKYVSAMGREPIVMLADYDQAVREHEIWRVRHGENLNADHESAHHFL